MKKIYADATSENWEKTNGSSWGKILVYYPARGKIRERVFRIMDPKLRQFINRFEFEAIKWANSLYKKKVIYSDSKVAVDWAKKEGVLCEWIPREENLAGFILEEYRLGYR